jgi:hypothetical protein
VTQAAVAAAEFAAAFIGHVAVGAGDNVFRARLHASQVSRRANEIITAAGEAVRVDCTDSSRASCHQGFFTRRHCRYFL